MQDPLRFRVADRRWLALTTKKIGDFGGFLNEMPTFVGHFHINQNITGEEFTLGAHTATATQFHHLFHRHKNFQDGVRFVLPAR